MNSRRSKIFTGTRFALQIAATGQQAVSVASGFDVALSIQELSKKLDGDARGGAALSMREVTHRTIKFAGTGEKLDQFELFIRSGLRGGFLEWAML